MIKTVHIPVLLEEVLEQLNVKAGGRFLDCTFGGGGHAQAILKANDLNTVVAIDRNPMTLSIAEVLKEKFNERFEFINMPFSNVLEINKYGPFDGILADLGFSSDQLSANLGFSFSDTELDMRMDHDTDVTAKDIVNTKSEGELKNIFKRGGVSKAYSIVSKAIIENRPINSAKELADCINDNYPKKFVKPGRHPATVFFQALRIEVNEEISELKSFLNGALTLLNQRGRLAVISFHSLEDKIVTKCMRKWGSSGDMPALHPGATKEQDKQIGKLLTRKAITPTDKEISDNPRSRSAMLRVFMKV